MGNLRVTQGKKRMDSESVSWPPGRIFFKYGLTTGFTAAAVWVVTGQARLAFIVLCLGLVAHVAGDYFYARISSRLPNRPVSGVLWFTGLSGAGKTTIATEVYRTLQRRGIKAECLDGDAIRAIFPNTGFSREDREGHVRRVGFLASRLERHGIVVVAALVSPYAESREFVRRQCGNFVEIYVSTPLEECERRDVKGLYAKARRGEIRNFTGISDPYEAPLHPAVTIDTTHVSLREATELALNALHTDTTWRRLISEVMPVSVPAQS